jgi:hypothetical protein
MYKTYGEFPARYVTLYDNWLSWMYQVYNMLWAQSTCVSGACPMCNPVNSPWVLGCLAHDGPGVTITPRSCPHSQSHENHLVGSNAKICTGHHAKCDNVYMCIKMETYSLYNLPKSHQGISTSNHEEWEPTMAPISCSDPFRQDTTSACSSFCNIPQSQSNVFYIGNDDQEAHKAPGLLSTLCMQSCMLPVDMTGVHTNTLVRIYSSA